MAAPQAFTWGPGGAQMTPEQIASQRKIAEALMAKGTDTSPIQHWSQGVNRVAQALMGGYDSYRADEADKTNRAADAEMLQGLLGGGPAPAASMPPAATGASPVAAAQPMGDVKIPAGKEEFVSTLMPLAQEASAKTGVDPRIIVAQAALESGWGRSAPGNNLFGIKSHGQAGGNTLPTTEVVNGQPVREQASFRAYPTQADSVNGYADFINTNPRYAGLKGAQGMDAQLAALQQSGYATDPNYGAKVGQIARGLPGGAPAPGPAPAAAPMQTAQATGLQGMDPRLLQAMTSPYASEATKKIATMLLQQKLQGDAVTTADAGDAIVVMDKRGNEVRRIAKGEPNKAPTFGKIGTDPNTGQDIMGWQDSRGQKVTPYSPPVASPAAPSTIPPAPPGVDPKVWREGQSKNALEAALPPDQKIVSGLRKEIQDLPSYKNLAQAAPVYKSMQEAAGRDTRAADVNLIYGLAKIMDPGSVVRESEMTVAQAVATLPQQLRATIESQLTGQGRLAPEVRDAIMQEAFGRMGSYDTMFGQDTAMYRGIAKRGRILEDDVIPNFGKFEPFKRAASPAGAPSIDDLVKKYSK